MLASREGRAGAGARRERERGLWRRDGAVDGHAHDGDDADGCQTGGSATELADLGPGGRNVGHLAYDAGDIWVASYQSNEILVVDEACSTVTRCARRARHQQGVGHRVERDSRVLGQLPGQRGLVAAALNTPTRCCGRARIGRDGRGRLEHRSRRPPRPPARGVGSHVCRRARACGRVAAGGHAAGPAPAGGGPAPQAQRAGARRAGQSSGTPRAPLACRRAPGLRTSPQTRSARRWLARSVRSRRDSPRPAPPARSPVPTRPCVASCPSWSPGVRVRPSPSQGRCQPVAAMIRPRIWSFRPRNRRSAPRPITREGGLADRRSVVGAPGPGAMGDRQHRLPEQPGVRVLRQEELEVAGPPSAGRVDGAVAEGAVRGAWVVGQPEAEMCRIRGSCQVRCETTSRTVVGCRQHHASDARLLHGGRCTCPTWSRRE